MSKEAERNFLTKAGQAARTHSLGKPFTDQYCGINLASIGTIMALLPAPPAKILDMGCGSGWTSVFYARRGYQVVGQDIASDMVELAELNKSNNAIGSNLSFVCSDFESTGFDGEFDAVIFFDCLHHAEDERAAMAAAYQALKPGGLLITHEPGEGHSVTQGSIEAMEQFGVDERDMPPHLIIKHARALGFASCRVYPMQHEIFELFYGGPPPRKWSSKHARYLARRVLQAAFRPNEKLSAIVVCVK